VPFQLSVVLLVVPFFHQPNPLIGVGRHVQLLALGGGQGFFPEAVPQPAARRLGGASAVGASRTSFHIFIGQPAEPPGVPFRARGSSALAPVGAGRVRGPGVQRGGVAAGGRRGSPGTGQPASPAGPASPSVPGPRRRTGRPLRRTNPARSSCFANARVVHPGVERQPVDDRQVGQVRFGGARQVRAGDPV